MLLITILKSVFYVIVFIRREISIVVINNVLFTSTSYIRLRKYQKCCYIILINNVLFRSISYVFKQLPGDGSYMSRK
jgi:hypothetical protein